MCVCVCVCVLFFDPGHTHLRFVGFLCFSCKVRIPGKGAVYGGVQVFGFVIYPGYIPLFSKKASEYDLLIPKSHTTDQPMVLRGRAAEHRLSQDIRKTVKAKLPALSSPSR